MLPHLVITLTEMDIYQNFRCIYVRSYWSNCDGLSLLESLYHALPNVAIPNLCATRVTKFCNILDLYWWIFTCLHLQVLSTLTNSLPPIYIFRFTINVIFTITLLYVSLSYSIHCKIHFGYILVLTCNIVKIDNMKCIPF